MSLSVYFTWHRFIQLYTFQNEDDDQDVIYPSNSFEYHSDTCGSALSGLDDVSHIDEIISNNHVRTNEHFCL